MQVFPVNFVKFLRTPLLQNTFRQLLLNTFQYPSISWTSTLSKLLYLIWNLRCQYIRNALSGWWLLLEKCWYILYHFFIIKWMFSHSPYYVIITYYAYFLMFFCNIRIFLISWYYIRLIVNAAATRIDIFLSNGNAWCTFLMLLTYWCSYWRCYAISWIWFLSVIIFEEVNRRPFKSYC